jgi:HSP20 family protein
MGELASLHSAMDRLFSDFFSSPLTEGGATTQQTWHLPVDVVDQGNAFQVKAAVPGFKPEDVEVTYHDGLLNISAQSSQESESKQGNYLRRELSAGSYSRSVQLPGDIKASDIKATFENGVLTIDLPKSPDIQPVKIPIGSGKSQEHAVGAGAKK